MGFLVSAFAKAESHQFLIRLIIIQIAVYCYDICWIDSIPCAHIFDSKYRNRFLNIILLH